MRPSEPTTYVVPEHLGRQRADKIVAALAELSRGHVARLIETGSVTIDGRGLRPSERLVAGTSIRVFTQEVSLEIVATPIEFDVAYEDDEVVVVDKPAGLVVHPGAGHVDDTLLNGLLHRFRGQRALGETRRFGLVHRLDRDTSGLLVVARTSEVYDDLRAKLEAHTVTRRYLALVGGHTQAGTGTIDAPIGRDPATPTRSMVRVDGRPARSHYRRLASWDEFTLLGVTLETGRTHQIRVHLQSIDLPIVGDRVYGRIDPRLDAGRTFLHATDLGFETVSGVVHVVESALPGDLCDVLKRLGEPTQGSIE